MKWGMATASRKATARVERHVALEGDDDEAGGVGGDVGEARTPVGELVRRHPVGLGQVIADHVAGDDGQVGGQGSGRQRVRCAAGVGTTVGDTTGTARRFAAEVTVDAKGTVNA